MKFEERYTLQVPLGESARGTIWSARDERLKRPAVVAVVETDAPEGTAVRFLEAWEPMQAARHPALPRLIERGTTGEDAPFVAMEKVDGEALAERLQDGPALRIDQLTRAMVEVADGLAVLHAKGGAHGDIEPSNILLRERGGRMVPKIVGLGLGRSAVRAGLEPLEDDEHLRTLAFMSPAQASGQSAGPADDAYALAAVLYSSMTGRLPHYGETVGALRKHVQETSVPPVADVRPDVAGPVADVVDRALQLDQEARFADCATLSKALRTALLKSRGLARMNTEVGERSLAPGPVVAKPKTMPPPKPTVSLPRPGAAMRKPTSPRPKAGGRPPVVARPKTKLPTVSPPASRPPGAPEAPSGAVDEELGFERLSGILEIPELDDKTGPPPFQAASSAKPSAPPPPADPKRLAKKPTLPPPSPRQPPLDPKKPAKKPTLPPPPPSPLGLQALGASPTKKTSAESPPAASAEHAEPSTSDDGGDEAVRAGSASAELPQKSTEAEAAEAEAAEAEAAEPQNHADEAAGEDTGDGEDAATVEPDDTSVEPDGTSVAVGGAEDVSDVAKALASGADGSDSEDPDASEAEQAAEDEDGQPDVADEDGSDEADAAPEPRGASDADEHAGLVPPSDDSEDAAPAIAPLSFDQASSDDVLPLKTGVPPWGWGAAAAALLLVLVVGGFLFGGDDESEPVVVGADAPARTEPASEPPASDPQTPQEVEPAPLPEPPPEPAEEPLVEEPPVVRLSGVPAGAHVVLDGAPVEGDVLTLDPALTSHVLRVTLDGHVPFETEWSGDAPDPLEVELEPVPAPVAEPPSPPVATGRRTSGRRTGGRSTSGGRASGRRATGRRTSSTRRGSTGRRRPTAVTDPGF